MTGIHSGSRSGPSVDGEMEGVSEAGRSQLRLLYLAVPIPATAFRGDVSAVRAAPAVELFVHLHHDRCEFLDDVSTKENLIGR